MGGHGHHKITIPDYKIYKVEDSPELLRVQEKLASIGLKDPWLRNEVWRFNSNITGGKTPFQRVITHLSRGFKPGVTLFIASIAGELAYKMIKKDDSRHHGPPPPPSDSGSGETVVPMLPESIPWKQTSNAEQNRISELATGSKDILSISKRIELSESDIAENVNESPVIVEKASSLQNVNTEHENESSTTLDDYEESTQNSEISKGSSSEHSNLNADSFSSEPQSYLFTIESHRKDETEDYIPETGQHHDSSSGESVNHLKNISYDNRRVHPEYTDSFQFTGTKEPPAPPS